MSIGRVISFLLPVCVMLAVSGQVTAEQKKKVTKPSEFPCLSYTAPCGKIGVRPVVKKMPQDLSLGDPERGKQIAFKRKKGNCLACHRMKGGSQSGTRGPDLSQYGSSGRTAAEIYAMIYDNRWQFPDTVMPPFGTNEVLTDREIRDVAAFLRASR
ncbi:sulfur oxidation c-type cytochrome SoxX [Thiohalomonas denitrificans]|uniref:Sulfur-oxidizing protein SoxX n=1 Tax=Thiohalomonas denitrificans TaxID=415747 RepID=A0A1G5PZQ5_9GAMM|nr:sulfur oxidation c-type cytochrome SoxX [Thiohalomonas denitrificans]SCZ54888.1 sulfur-oxidizing protein SoxX [Thiohalomonas denitrificans]